MSTFGRQRATCALKAPCVVLELAAEMLAPLRRDLAQDRDRALELAGGHLLEVDLVLLQEPVEVRHRGDDADPADDGERRGDDAVGRAAIM